MTNSLISCLKFDIPIFNGSILNEKGRKFLESPLLDEEDIFEDTKKQVIEAGQRGNWKGKMKIMNGSEKAGSFILERKKKGRDAELILTPYLSENVVSKLKSNFKVKKIKIELVDKYLSKGIKKKMKKVFI